MPGVEVEHQKPRPVAQLHFIQRTDGEDEATQADGKEVLAQKDLPD